MSTDIAAGLMDYARRATSPFHACRETARLLESAGFTGMTEVSAFPTDPGRYYLVRGGSLVAWSTEGAAGATNPAGAAGGAASGRGAAPRPFRVVGAHTDSPNLRIKPRPDVRRAGFAQLGVEVYGGPLLNSWLDRDLGLSGRVSVRADALPPGTPTSPGRGDDAGDGGGDDAGDGSAGGGDSVCVAPGLDPAGVRTLLVRIDRPLLRVAQLAVHLDRAVNSEGVRLNQQQHLAPIWALDHDKRDFAAFLAEAVGVGEADVLAWDIMTHDVQPPALIGMEGDLVAAGRMDNLATCFAATRALIDRVQSGASSSVIPLLVMFDHEEVGSVSERGAQSSLLPVVMERIVLSGGGSREDFHRAMAGTVIASGDMAHATHPNYVDRHEPEHHITIGGGPVLKVNNQLRYATGSPGAAAFALACEQAGVPMQRFVTRSDLPCGSTVGPVTAARTGAQTVDFGAPMLSMHSARELVGARDMEMYVSALEAFFLPPES